MAEFKPDYSRQTRLKGIGQRGQQQLASSRVLVIGAGGLGSVVLPLLGGAGVGHLTIVDDDTLEASNLHRQTLYRSHQVGQSKAQLAAQAIAELNPEVAVTVIQQKLDANQLLEQLSRHHLVLECTDDFKNKLMVSDAAVLLNKPAIFASAVQREGQLQTYTGESDSACLRCLWQSVPSQPLSCEQTGVLGSVPAFIGSLQATEALQFLLQGNDEFFYQGIKNRVLFYDAATFKQRSIPLQLSSQCLAHDQQFNQQQYLLNHPIDELPLEFTGTLNEAVNNGLAIIDVRDVITANQQPLAVPCINIPAQQLAADQQLLTSQRTLLVCYGGFSSLGLASQLREKGFTEVYSKAGGASTP